MEKRNNVGKISSPASEGVGAGLRIWIFFLASFYWLGYSPRLSMALAVIAGLAGGFIVAWWQIVEEPSQIESPIANKRTLAQASRERTAKKQKFTRKPKASIKRRRNLTQMVKLLGKKDTLPRDKNRS